LYTEGEFDIGKLDPIRPRMAELGRTCTAPEWRRGAVMLLLWAALAEFMDRTRLDHMIGCASVPMHDGGHEAASLWQSLRGKHLAAPGYRVLPRRPLPLDRLDTTLAVDPPALIKGYLRCGGRVLGAPAWDADFGVADLPMMLDLADLPASYRARFVGA
jgi:putative hemolysin